MKEQTMDRNESISLRLANFTAKHRTLLWGALALSVLIIAAAVIWDNISSTKDNEAALLANEINQSFQDWTYSLETERDSSELLEFVDKALTDYQSTFAHQRALFVRGQYYFEEEMWDEAAADYLALADTFEESYLAPVALFNGATALEETGNVEEAIELLSRLSNDFAGKSPIVPEAIFNLGRLAEEQGDKEEAKSYYEQLIIDFSDTDWTNLAKSRIISMDI